MKNRLAALAIGATLFGACGGDSTTAPAIPSATGTWSGSFTTTSGGTNVVLTLSMVETSENVLSGNGSFQVGSNSLVANVTGGVHNHPAISITVSVTGFDDLLIMGTFTDDDTISASLVGSGFSGEGIVMLRTG